MQLINDLVIFVSFAAGVVCGIWYAVSREFSRRREERARARELAQARIDTLLSTVHEEIAKGQRNADEMLAMLRSRR